MTTTTPLKIYSEALCDPESFEIVTEQFNQSSAPRLKIRGPYIFTGVTNLNNRGYDDENIADVVKLYETDNINHARGSGGELNHPKATKEDPGRLLRVEYERICHRINSIKKINPSDKFWIGESEVLSEFPCGKIVEAMIKSGYFKPGVSLRGAGSQEKGSQVVMLKKLITVDIVSDPSNADYGAWCDAITESQNIMMNEHGELVLGPYAEFNKAMSKMPNKSDARALHAINAIKKFTDSLSRRNK